MKELFGKKVVVLGFGRTGYSVSKLLCAAGARVLVSEKQPRDLFEQKASELQALGVEFEFAGHTRRIFDADFIVVSPGVSMSEGILSEVESSDIPVYSEIEVASWFNKGIIIGVTGSNGKSTTATLIHRIFMESGRVAYLAGNIGLPFAEIAAKTGKDDIVVLELSSFQLERVASFAPYVSVVLNLSPDHLDRYSSVDHYYSAKTNIWANQKESDFAVIRLDDRLLMNLIDRCKAKPIGFARSRFELWGAYVFDGWINIVGDNGGIERLIEVNSLGLLGPHNEWNAAAAVAASLPFNIPKELLCRVLADFKGIEHRLEFVREIDGIRFYNDSKATNPDSLFWALQSFSGSIVLIAGGLDKGTDFSFLRPLIEKRVKCAILIGKAKYKLQNDWKDSTKIIICDDMRSAVYTAYSLSSQGDIVLLSPGCASFDMFENFEHRGKVFKGIVNELKPKTETKTR